MFGLVLFFAPFLAPLAPMSGWVGGAIAGASGGAIAGASGEWQVTGEGQWSSSQSLQPQIGAVQGIAFTSEQGLTTLFSWSRQGLWRSADYGRTWNIVGAGLPRTRTGAQVLVDLQSGRTTAGASPANASGGAIAGASGGVHTLYALAGPAGRRGLYRSTDRGARFDLLYQPLTFNPDLLAVRASDQGDIVALAGDETLVLSHDGGAGWRDFRAPGRIEALAVTELGLWAAGSGGTNVDGAEFGDQGFGDQTPTGWVAYTTRDGEAAAGKGLLGQQWQLMVLPDGVLPRFLVGAERGPVQWYLGHRAGLLRSSDSGGSWQPVNLPEGVAPIALVLDPLVWETLLLADATGGLWRSDDAGVSWRMLPVPASGAIRKLFLAPDDRARLFAVAGFDLWWLPQMAVQPTPSATPRASPTPTSTPTAVVPMVTASPTQALPLLPRETAPATATPKVSDLRLQPSSTLTSSPAAPPRPSSTAAPIRQPVADSTNVAPTATPTTVATAPPSDTPVVPDVALPTATPPPPPPTPIPTPTSYR